MKKSILRKTWLAVAAALFCVLHITCNGDSGAGGAGDYRADAFVRKYNRPSTGDGGNGGGTPTHTHTWGGWVVTTAATCDAAGVETRTCTQDASHKETRAIPKLTGAACESGGGGELPASILIPVTFYDFRSDRSNPEFEQPHGKVSGCTYNSTVASGACIRVGMVANTLDADNKPTLGPSPYRNYGIAHWFRDWNTYLTGPYSKGTNMAPVYNPTPGIRQTYNNEWGATVTYVGDQNVGHDTSFKNIVIKDNLTFTRVNATADTYQFDRRGNNGFFPLDGSGFGNEWVSEGGARHNFAFTMELAFDFQAKAGMTFEFTGDDDVWVFIDKTLVLDLGGIHEALSARFNLSDIPNVVNGKTHTLRVFYAERHSTASNILIQTNIVAPPDGNGSSNGSGVGGSYESVTLGGLKWMKKNLNVATADSWCYDNNNSNCNTYGRLYTWEAAKSACQSVGWRLPTNADWGALVTAAGGLSVAGKALKSTSGWSDSGNGADTYGFLALPGGYRVTKGSFYDVGYDGYWWTATEYNSDYAYYRNMYCLNDGMEEYYLYTSDGLSVRCVQD